MLQRSFRAGFVVLLTAGALLSGCTTAAKQVLHEVRGAHAEILLVNNVPNGALAAYQGVVFEQPSTTLSSRLCPPSVLGELHRYANRLEEDLVDVYPGGTPALHIDSDVLYFQRKGILGTAQLLTRVKMRSEDLLVVDALVNASSKSFREGAGDDLAEATIDEIGDFLREQKAPRDER